MANQTAAATKKRPPKGKRITHANVRMYRLGTGDCFVVKFFSGQTRTFTMMIDCGAWQGKREALSRYVSDLKQHVGNRVDVLVVTHEHTDHVLGFEMCEDLFTDNFEVGQIWMAWTEEDGDALVEKWRDDDGQKKKALAAAARKLTAAVNDPTFEAHVKALHRGAENLGAQRRFAEVLGEFTQLQMAVNDRGYVGPLKGMAIVKEKLAVRRNGKSNIRYYKPGNIIEQLPGLEGVRIFVLGPPQAIEAVHQEDSGTAGETYEHNKELAKSNAFAAAVTALDSGGSPAGLAPFDDKFVSGSNDPLRQAYEHDENRWRRIDHDWLLSAGSLALRLNSGINNLSLALAIEFVDSGRVMLFPGDAEYGSWASWHSVPWKVKGRGKNPDGSPKQLTEDLLNRTVFYKVAHHLSHNGTAKRLGLDLMTHEDLTAMATLDYGVISRSWTGTMPNQGLLHDLLEKTKGRLLVMRTDRLFFDARKTIPLDTKIEQAREAMSPAERAAFEAAHRPPKPADLFIDFRVKA